MSRCLACNTRLTDEEMIIDELCSLCLSSSIEAAYEDEPALEDNEDEIQELDFRNPPRY